MKKEIVNNLGQKLTFESVNGVLKVSVCNGLTNAAFDLPNTEAKAFFESAHAVVADVLTQPLTEEQQRAISERWGSPKSNKQPF